MSAPVNTADVLLVRRTLQIARQARRRGNHPFGALLADADGNILLEAENTVVTAPDCTGHAETNLMRRASAMYGPDVLAGCTVYTSTEPCAMCAGAIFWGNVRRVVFGLSAVDLYEMIGESSEDALKLPSREVFARGRKDIEVVGPVVEAEAREVHKGFWESIRGDLPL